jgi:endogenous inhibitor of DNA gyrase (YacG/DUF329 family)
MTNQKIQVKCKACGGVFEAFLNEMAQHNGQVTCPGCGQSCEYSSTEMLKASTGD